MVASVGLWLILLVWCFWLPGRLLVSRTFPEAVGIERFALSAFLGTMAVSVTTFTITSLAGLFAPVFVSKGALIGVGGLWSVGSWLGLRRGEGAVRPRSGWSAQDRWILAAGLAVFAIFLVNFDRSLFHDAECLSETTFASLGNWLADPSGRLPARNVTLRVRNGFPQGGAALFAPFLALFEFFGFRLLHAGCGLLIFLFGTLTALRFPSPLWLAIGAGAALALNPQVLSIAVPNENLLFLAVAAGLFYLLVRPGLTGFWLGMVIAMLLGIGHQSLLSMGAVAVAFAAHPTRRREGWLNLVAGTIFFSIPWLAHHLVVSLEIGRPYLLETFDQFDPIPHRLFGIPMSIRGLWNFPFVSSMVRSPFAAYPPAFLFPMRFLSRFGLLLSALVPLGAAWLWRRDRRLLAVCAFWIVPAYLLLAVQANWVEEKKMGVLLALMPPLVLLMGAGANAVRARPILGIAAWCAFLAVLAAFVTLVNKVDFPLDERSYVHRPHGRVFGPEFPLLARRETQDYLRAERVLEGRLSFLPDARAVPLTFAPLAKALLRDLGDELAHPRFDQVPLPIYDRVLEMTGLRRMFPSPLAAYRKARGVQARSAVEGNRNAVVPRGIVALDFRDSWVGGIFLRPYVPAPGASPPQARGKVIASLPPREDQVLRDVKLRWSDEPGQVLMLGSGPAGAVVLLFGESRRFLFPPAGALDSRDYIEGEPATTLGLGVTTDRPITVMELSSVMPSRAYLWWLAVGTDGKLRVHGPIPYTVL